jgi:hypothetical protein
MVEKAHGQTYGPCCADGDPTDKSMMKFDFLWRPVLCVVLLLLFSASAQAADVNLAWNPNTEKDLKGYGVYFSQGTNGPPYQLAGYVDVADLPDPQEPVFTISGLTAGTDYSIAVTAYDTSGNESYYSQPVCAEAGVSQVECAASGYGEDGGGSGGGGGGGCFIGSVHAGNKYTPAAMLFIFAAILILL